MNEQCEWNPLAVQPAAINNGCQNDATVYMNWKGGIHVCDSCSQQDTFKRFKKEKLVKHKDNKQLSMLTEDIALAT